MYYIGYLPRLVAVEILHVGMHCQLSRCNLQGLSIPLYSYLTVNNGTRDDRTVTMGNMFT